MEDKKMITITYEEYDRLLKRNRLLDALKCAGVDNWEGYGIAWDYLDDEE